MYILEKYLRMAASYQSGTLSRRNHFQFKCNVCGDSSSNKRQKRGHLSLINKGSDSFWIYKCFNAGCPAEDTWSAERWLRTYYPDLHRQYVREILENKTTLSSIIVEEKIEEKKPKKKIKKNDFPFVPVNKRTNKFEISRLQKLAQEMRSKRNIPKEIFDKWFVCVEGTYKGRVILPFYDDNEEIYYFQARALDSRVPKYLNALETRDKALYNIFNIDRNKPVIIVEGPIDSMFIENSIATTGLSFSKNVKDILGELDGRWLLDNDSSGREKSKELLKEGKYVFMWKKFPNSTGCKDINDYIVKNGKDKLSLEDLLPYFTNNFYDGVFI